MIEKPFILDLSLEEMKTMLSGIGYEPYRVEQIKDWIFKKFASSYDEMTNLPKELRSYLAENVDLVKLSMLEVYEEKRGQAKRYLWGINGSACAESVLLKYKYGTTACLSTQVGCPVQCKFCASGKLGFERNLTRGEILDQLLGMCRHTSQRISRVVFMGTGEPFLNYDNVMEAIDLLSSESLYDMSRRKMTISTVGIPDAIRKFSNDSRGVRLALSLHASSNGLRDELIPLNRAYPLGEIMSAVRYFSQVTGQRVTFEYMLLKDINDSDKDAQALANLIKDMDCLVNLIPWNPVPGVPYEASDADQVNRFKKILEKNHIKVTMRRKLGSSIEGACGQLRRAKT